MQRVIILVLIYLFISITSVSAQLGMPAPECDEVLEPALYFDKYIDSAEFKALHPTFLQWIHLPDNYSDQTVCINEDEKAVLMWSFILPASLSEYQFKYKYTVTIVVNWDKSAQLAYKITPEELIAKAESMSEVKEFISKFENELATSEDNWIRSNSYSVNSGYVSPLEISYRTDNRDTIAVSDKGVEFADLKIHQEWLNFPTVRIGLNLVENALASTDCKLDKPSTAVSRYTPTARRNDQESEEFIYNSYKISCSESDYRYSGVHIYPNDGRFQVWLQNTDLIASGKISDEGLKKVQATSRLDDGPTDQSELTYSQARSIEPPSENLSGSKNLKLIQALAIVWILITPLIYILIKKIRKPKKAYSEPVINENMTNSSRDQTQSEQNQSNPQLKK